MATTMGAKTPAQLFALVFGVVYLLIGIVGFAVTGFNDFATRPPNPEELIVFSLNPLHNIVHIGVGALFIGGSRTHAGAKSINLLIGVVYALVGVLGLLNVDFLTKLLAMNDADDFLHIATAIGALYFGTVGAEGPARTAAA